MPPMSIMSGGTSFKVLFADRLYLIGAGCYQIFNLDDFQLIRWNQLRQHFDAFLDG